MEVLVVEVPEEPEDARSEYLSQQHHERGQVEDEDHPSQPVEEGDRTYSYARNSTHKEESGSILQMYICIYTQSEKLMSMCQWRKVIVPNINQKQEHTV